MCKVLFTDDNAEWLNSLRRIFRDNNNVEFAECHGVDEALHAIKTHRPEIILLDHQLTEGGSEGFEIINKLKGFKVYSTTSNREAVREYQKRGIEVISKNDITKIRSIVGP